MAVKVNAISVPRIPRNKRNYGGGTGSNSYYGGTVTPPVVGGYLEIQNNLSDVADPATSRDNLGLKSLATVAHLPCTQTEYDAIVVKDSNTIYLVEE